MGTQKVSFFAFETVQAVDFVDLKAGNPPLPHTHTHTLANEESVDNCSGDMCLSNLPAFCPKNRGEPVLLKHNQTQAVDHYSAWATPTINTLCNTFCANQS